ncbi:hypothetical protein ACKI1J_11680 [Streptomyces scabiei]|uniref:hypothetical protein n=1 Tax=Streptomyces scabiei TaxID=1930 RepID=UPI0038F75DD0
MSDVREGRSRRARAAMVLFRVTMAVVIALFAWRTYEEVAIAAARSSGTLEQADATVVNRTEERKESLGGTGQDRTAEVTVRYEVTLDLQVNGEVRSVPDDGSSGLYVHDHAQAGLWHGHVIELNGDYVWRGWHSGTGGNVLLAFYPLAMGYSIVLVVAARVRRARRGRTDAADSLDVAWGGTFGIIVGTVTIVPLALVPAALGTDHPRYWPLIPVATGVTAALLVIQRLLRRRQSRPTPAAVNDTPGAQDAPTHP